MEGRFIFAAHGVRGDGSVQWSVRTNVLTGKMETLGTLRKRRANGRVEWLIFPHGGRDWHGPFKTRKACLESAL